MRRRDTLKQQCIRLAIWTPIAIAVTAYTVHQNGWAYTWAYIKFFAINCSILVALTKKLGWI